MGLRFSLRRSLPLKKAFAGDEPPDERTNNCIEREQCLVRKEDKVEEGHEQGLPKAGECLADASFPVARERTSKSKTEHHEGRENEDQKQNDSPIKGTARQPQPAGQEQDEGKRLDERTAQVVEDLPAGDRGNGVWHPIAGLIRDPCEHPLDYLPVAAYPAMFAADVRTVMRRVIVDDFDIGSQSRSRVRALYEVMAKQGVSRETILKHGMEDGDFINALAGKAALAKQILIGIGNSARVYIESALARVDGRQA